MKLTNGQFNFVRFLVEIILPGVGVLYSALALTWGWGNAENVVATIAAVTVFLGLFITYFRKKFEGSGDLIVTETSEGTALALDLNESPDSLVGQNEVLFRIKDESQ